MNEQAFGCQSEGKLHSSQIMPIYEYHCEACGSDFELLVRQGKELECPECSSLKLLKQWSTFAPTGEAGGLGSSASSGHGSSCGCCGPSDGGCGLN